jgi:hypothetical protein
MRVTVVPFVLLGLACAPTPATAPSSMATPTVQVERAPESHASEVPVLGLELGLPQPPPFAEPDVPILAEDNTWSVLGLRSYLSELLPEAEAGRVVLVSAYVQEVYEPPRCPDGELCPPGKQPHAWLVDDPALRGKQRAMLVTGIYFPIPEWDVETQQAWASEPELELEPGRRYVFMGWFRRFTDSGFAHDRGLLELLAVSEYPLDADARWTFPRNSQQHPKARAELGLEPLAPELAHVPAGVVAGSALPEPGPLVEPSDHKDAMRLGREEAWAGHPRRADYYFRWMIVDDPSKAAGWVELGSFYVDYGEPELGLEILDLALQRSPNDYALHNARGRLLLNVGEPTAAVESYLRAAELAPDAPDVLFGLGMAYAEIPERQRAIETLQRFLDVAKADGAEVPDHIIKAAQDTMLRMSY